MCCSKYGSLSDVEDGAKRLAQVVLGASHLVQKSVANLLDPDNQDIHHWKEHLRETLEHQANFLCNKLFDCPGLDVGKGSQGAMYAIVRIDLAKFDTSIATDRDFSSLLLQEENVFVLPGTAFGVPGLFRVVFCASEDVLASAASRIQSFCKRHVLAD